MLDRREVDAELRAYASAYENYWRKKPASFDVAVATRFATDDLFNMAKHSRKEDAVYIICDETNILREAANNV